MALSSADVQRAFQNSLGRAPSQSELNTYLVASQDGAGDTQIYTTISNSREADLNVDPVVRFYQTAFGRVPDQAGLDNATDYIRQFGATAETYQKLADMFVQSPEFQARFPGTGVTAEYVQDLYTTILGRQATTAEIQAYVSGSNGYDTRGEVLYAISQSNEAITRTDAAVNSFLLDATEGDAVYTGPLPGSSSGEPTQPSEPTTPTQPTNPGTGDGGTPSVPTTFTLTTAADTYPGTANADTINGTVGSEGTFTTADRIDGASGTDTFNITVTGNEGGAIAIPLAQFNPETKGSTPTVTNVEIFNIRNTSGQVATFNAGAITGEMEVWNDQSSGGDLSVTDLATGATIGVRGDPFPLRSTDATDTSFTYANSTDAITIAVDNGVGNDFFGLSGPNISRDDSGAALVTITSTGAANVLGTIDLDNAAATIKTVTINATTDLNAILSDNDYAAGAVLTLNGPGAIDLQRGSLSANITTINAANSSGGVDVRAENTADLIFTGGKGNDTLRLGSSLPSADSIDGGFGTDTVEISGGTFTDGENAVVQGIQKLDSIEQLRIINSTTTTIDDSLLQNAITKLIFADGNDGEFVEVINASTRTYAFQNDDGDAAFTAKSGVTTLNLEFDSSMGTSNETTLAASGHDLINIVTTGSSSFGFFLPPNGSSSDAIGSLQVEQGTTINISGANAFSIGSIGGSDGSFDSSSDGVTVDATKLDGKLVLGASNGIDTIEMGAGGSVVVGGGSGDNITFGSGSDQALYFADFGAAESGVVTGSGSAREIVGIDTITGFTAGNSSNADKLAAFNFNNVFGGPTSASGTNNTYTTLSANQSTAVSNATSLTAAIDAAASAHTASGWTAFSYQGSTYALHESVANGSNGQGETFGTGDSVVELVGVTVANLTQANFGLTEGQQYPGFNFNLLP